MTSLGWVFHYTDGALQRRDADPAFTGTITFRPNEAAEQFVPDVPPVDRVVQASARRDRAAAAGRDHETPALAAARTAQGHDPDRALRSPDGARRD